MKLSPTSFPSVCLGSSTEPSAFATIAWLLVSYQSADTQPARGRSPRCSLNPRDSRTFRRVEYAGALHPTMGPYDITGRRWCIPVPCRGECRKHRSEHSHAAEDWDANRPCSRNAIV